MSFSLKTFVKVRPFLYHVTAAKNLDGLRALRKLISVTELSEEYANLAQPRGLSESAYYRGAHIGLGDQRPLCRNRNQMCLDGGWEFEKFLQELNRRVFFFPGTPDRLPRNCEDFIRRKEANKLQLAILRIPTMLLINENRDKLPEFCKHNSGAPRMTNGRRSPRGPNTFVNEKTASFTSSQVKEVSLIGSVFLPKSTTLRRAAGWADF